MFLQDFIGFFLVWFRTRRWRTLLLCGCIAFTLPCVLLAYIVYGFSLRRGVMANAYLAMVESELDQAIDSYVQSPTDFATEHIRHINVPLRRALELGNGNERIVFAVADGLAWQGRTSDAERMMLELVASQDSYQPARIWLDQAKLQRQQFIASLDSASSEVLDAPNRSASE